MAICEDLSYLARFDIVESHLLFKAYYAVHRSLGFLLNIFIIRFLACLFLLLHIGPTL